MSQQITLNMNYNSHYSTKGYFTPFQTQPQVNTPHTQVLSQVAHALTAQNVIKLYFATEFYVCA